MRRRSIRVFFEVYGPGLASGDVARTLSGHFDGLGDHYASALTHLLTVGEVRPDLDTRSAGRALASLVDGMVLHGALFGASPRVGPGLRSESHRHLPARPQARGSLTVRLSLGL